MLSFTMRIIISPQILLLIVILILTSVWFLYRLFNQEIYLIDGSDLERVMPFAPPIWAFS